MERSKTQATNTTSELSREELELEIARQNITFYDEILDEDEAIRFDELQRLHWEDTIRYEQTHKRQ